CFGVDCLFDQKKVPLCLIVDVKSNSWDGRLSAESSGTLCERTRTSSGHRVCLWFYFCDALRMQDGKWRGKSSVKRLFDIFVSFLGLVLLFPFLLLAAVFIKLDSSGPVFFRQERIGRGFRPFSSISFVLWSKIQRLEVSLLRWAISTDHTSGMVSP